VLVLVSVLARERLIHPSAVLRQLSALLGKLSALLG